MHARTAGGGRRSRRMYLAWRMVARRSKHLALYIFRAASGRAISTRSESRTPFEMASDCAAHASERIVVVFLAAAAATTAPFSLCETDSGARVAPRAQCAGLGWRCAAAEA